LEIKFNINTNVLIKIFIAFITFELLLASGYVIGNMIEHPISFNLDEEANLPSWFSSMQLFLIGLVFWIKGLQSNYEAPPSTLFLKLIGSGFIYLSADEVSQFHEKIGWRIRLYEDLYNIVPHFKGGHGLWISIYGFIASVLILIFYKDIINTLKRYRQASIIMIAGLITALMGGVFFEVIGYDLRSADSTSIYYVYEIGAEEFLEMLGFSIVLFGATLMLIHEYRIAKTSS